MSAPWWERGIGVPAIHNQRCTFDVGGERIGFVLTGTNLDP
jgi:hypothetical protein